jgi:hypothetical protein
MWQLLVTKFSYVSLFERELCLFSVSSKWNFVSIETISFTFCYQLFITKFRYLFCSAKRFEAEFRLFMFCPNKILFTFCFSMIHNKTPIPFLFREIWFIFRRNRQNSNETEVCFILFCILWNKIFTKNRMPSQGSHDSTHGKRTWRQSANFRLFNLKSAIRTAVWSSWKTNHPRIKLRLLTMLE